ncbi:hypothetical protein F4054_03935 [Candidatus Poribacteria bacterium]|nr:hypothetical protein [Candidatus Poribacteria bacterium]MYK21392.1 hypothetical protein [Candidatus Poribacteria bacterium]
MENLLGQFYTKSEVADACWEHFTNTLSTLNRNLSDLFFVEPAAGTGAFYKLLPSKKRFGIDLVPKCKDVKRQDFFSVTDLPFALQDTVVIGNPPFGKRGKLAIAFFNHAAHLADIIAFIVPVNFRKFTTHKQLEPDMRFISKLPLPRDAFHLSTGKSYAVNTEFQIWTRLASTAQNMRQYEPLPIQHKDFQIWQYNNTPDALKVFQNPFDFAVPCQGWQDYSRRETDEKQCEKRKQWILLKAKNPTVLARLMEIDYEHLALECATAVPGFRKGDLVKAYTDYYEK